MRYLVRFLRVCALVLIPFIGCGDSGDEGCEVPEINLCIGCGPCDGVVCPPDDNECSTEYCSDGLCNSRPVADGRSCTYDSLFGVCANGVCGENLCEGCDDDNECTKDLCNYVNGTCNFFPEWDGVLCEFDGVAGACLDGACAVHDCQGVPDGAACSLATSEQPAACLAGECRTLCEAAEECDDLVDCTADVCTPVDGNSACDSTAVADGTPCAGGTCQTGVCELTDTLVPCTQQGIRNAIAEGGGPYTFDCDGPTTVVTKAEIAIDNDVILDGEGNLTVDGNDTHRIFLVARYITAELRGVTVTGGAAQDGGGIFNAGVLALTDSAVSSNTSNTASIWGGGGIFNAEVLTLTNCTVSDNSAYPSGGGIYNDGTLTLTNSTVSGNLTTRDGGGIENYGMLTVTNSTVSENEAVWSSGGGISNRSDGTVTLTNSTVSGNTANWFGGGILNTNRGVVTVMNSTVSGNEASSGGGGIYNNVDTLTLTNSLVDGECYCDAGCDGIVTSNGYNIESPGSTCGFDQSTDKTGVLDPMLGPLQDNGGPTETHALLPGSVAIDHIPAVDCEVDEDQRGEPRPETGGDGCDVGAFEVQSGD